MRIDGTRSYARISSKGHPSSSDSSATFDLGIADQAPEARATQSSAPASSLDSLIALQFVEDTSQRRKRGFRRGRSMLDALDKLKVSLLSGSIPAAELARLLSAVSGRERDSDDPQLETILDEIELRARVELAKLRPQRRVA